VASDLRASPACYGTRHAFQNTLISRQQCGVCSFELAKARHALDRKALELRVHELDFELRVAQTGIEDNYSAKDNHPLDQCTSYTESTEYGTTNTSGAHIEDTEEQRYDYVISELAAAEHNLSLFMTRSPNYTYLLERSYPISRAPKVHHRPSTLASRSSGPSSLRHEIKAEDIPEPKRKYLPSKCYNKNDSAIDLQSTMIETEHIEFLEDDFHLDAGIEDVRIENTSLDLEGEYSDENFVVYDDEAEGTKKLVNGWPGEEDLSQQVAEANDIWTEAIAEMEYAKENAWTGLQLRVGRFGEARKAFNEMELAGIGLGF